MGRWGEEEKKTKGLWGCFFAFFVFSTFAYTLYINYEATADRRLIESRMQSLVRTSFRKTDQELVGDITQICLNVGHEVNAGDVRVKKVKDKYGNYEVDVYIRYVFKVNLIITSFPVTVPIVETVTLIQ